LDPAKLDQDSTLVGDLAEAYRQLPGFQSWVLATDRATGRLIHVSTFDTEEHARYVPTREDLNARIQAVGSQPDGPPEFFEVITTA